MIQDHVMMEIERQLADMVHYAGNPARVLKLTALSQFDLSLPNDDLEIAEGLWPLDPEGAVFRGSVRFPLVTTAFGHTCRRLARCVYAMSLRDDQDRETGETIRALDSSVSQVDILVLDQIQGRFVWERIDDRMLPLAAIRELDALMVADATRQEQGVWATIREI